MDIDAENVLRIVVLAQGSLATSTVNNAKEASSFYPTVTYVVTSGQLGFMRILCQTNGC